jgi:prevent-host-death family protein
MSTMTAREFNRDVSAAKRAAAQGPVVITDRGEPAFVLLAIKDYERLTDERTIVDWLRMEADVDFEPGRVESLPRAADL